LRRNPMFRALRLDKLIYQALEVTLRNLLLERWNLIPAVHMISLSSEALHARARELAAKLDGINAEALEGNSVVGGGATPEQPLQSWLVAVECKDVVRSEYNLRLNDPPVVARIEEGRLIFDVRTVFPNEMDELAQAIRKSCAA